MEKLNKQKILAVVLIIALIAAFVCAVSLLYNAIEMLHYTPYYLANGKPTDVFTDLQKPLAIILLVAAIVSFVGIAAGISVFICKNRVLKIAFMIISIVVAVAFIAFISAGACKWQAYFHDTFPRFEMDKWPHCIATGFADQFLIYTESMPELISGLVLFTIIAASVTTAFILDLKAEKPAQEKTVATVPEENI